MRAPPRVVWPCGPPWLCADIRATCENGSIDPTRGSAPVSLRSIARVRGSRPVHSRTRPCVGPSETRGTRAEPRRGRRGGTRRNRAGALTAGSGGPRRRRPVRSSGIAIAAPLAWWLLTAGPMGSSCGRRARSAAAATGRTAMLLAALGVAATGCGDAACAMGYYARVADPCARAQPNPRDLAWGCRADTSCPCGAPCSPPIEDVRRTRCAVPGAQVPACVLGNVR